MICSGHTFDLFLDDRTVSVEEVYQKALIGFHLLGHIFVFRFTRLFVHFIPVDSLTILRAIVRPLAATATKRAKQ